MKYKNTKLKINDEIKKIGKIDLKKTQIYANLIKFI